MKKHYQAYEIDMNTLGYYVDRLLYTMLKRHSRVLKERNSDLQPMEFLVLKMVNALGEASQTQVAELMGKERSGIGRLIMSLENKGYIKREALNGSTNLVTLSEKGKEVVPFLHEISASLTERAFRGFSQRSRLTTLKNLDKIYRNIITEG